MAPRLLGRPRRLLVAAAVIGASTLALVGQASGSAASGKYLLAVGDSLAAGYQPTDGSKLPPLDSATGYRDTGYLGSYPGDIAAAGGLRLIDLGCPGETTTSISGVPAQKACATLYRSEFGSSSQLAAAEAFLARHRGTVAEVTLDIGANDLDRCATSANVDFSCLAKTDAAVIAHLSGIAKPLLAALHKDDPGARMFAMNYYDPFLGLAFSPGGSSGLRLALESVAATDTFDGELEATFAALGVGRVDVASAFQTDSPLPTSRYGGKLLPEDVATVCRLTWMCPTTKTTQPDIHPTSAGYRTIATAFERALGWATPAPSTS